MGFLGFGTKLCRNGTYGFLRFFVPEQIGRFLNLFFERFQNTCVSFKQLPIIVMEVQLEQPRAYHVHFHFHSNQPHQP